MKALSFGQLTNDAHTKMEHAPPPKGGWSLFRVRKRIPVKRSEGYYALRGFCYTPVHGRQLTRDSRELVSSAIGGGGRFYATFR